MCVEHSMSSGVLKSDFQFLSGMFPWGFANLLGFQEELGVRFLIGFSTDNSNWRCAFAYFLH